MALPAETDAALPVTERRPALAVFSDLVKARLTFLVLVTTLVGFCMGLGSGPLDRGVFLACLMGTMGCAAGAAAWNQWWERRADALMQRTRTRPLPSGEMQPWQAILTGALLCAGGLLVLGFYVNTLSMWVALATIVSYVFIYTPLKKVTTLNTVIGAVPGALPPVIGYTASTGRMDQLAGILFAILFLWQLPHFLAISWIYREDYQRGGFAMLSCRDREGGQVSARALIYTVMLMAVCVLPWWLGFNSVVYLAAAIFLNAAYLLRAFQFFRSRALGDARKLFLVSIIYLPVLLGIMVFTRR